MYVIIYTSHNHYYLCGGLLTRAWSFFKIDFWWRGQDYFVIYFWWIYRIAYSGRGLEYGDCGITIFKVEDGHYGNWSCIVRKGSNYRRAEEIHLLKLSPPTTNSMYKQTFCSNKNWKLFLFKLLCTRFC